MDSSGRNSTAITTTDTQITTGKSTYFGASVRGGAAALGLVIIRDGTSSSGEIIDIFSTALGTTETHFFGPNGITVNTGIFADVDGVAQNVIVFW